MGGRREALGRMIPVLPIYTAIIPPSYNVFYNPFITFLTFT
jgi:hypothetical protein